MSQHALAVTLINMDDEYVTLSTHRHFIEDSTRYVETVDGVVKEEDLRKAHRGREAKLSVYDEAGNYDKEAAELLSELLTEKRKSKLGKNIAAPERETTIKMPAVDTVGFKFRVWYYVKFAEAGSIEFAAAPRENLVAVERTQAEVADKNEHPEPRPRKS